MTQPPIRHAQKHRLHAWLVSFLAAVLGAGMLLLTPGAASASTAAMTAPIYQRANPSSGASLLTPYSDEASAAANYGYTTNLRTPFKVALSPATGLGAVHRLWNGATGDFTDALAGSTRYQQAVASGYADQGVRYYALTSAVSGQSEPVNVYAKSGKTRLATAAAGSTLAGQGWALQGVAFHVPLTTSAPAPTPAPTPTPAPATGYGSVPVGQASYPVPAGAIFVAPSGNDGASGSQSAPVRTISRAVAIAPGGGTVVIRGGTYRETVKVWNKTLTIQNYPGEAVWLDGSVPVSGWVGEGSIWRKDGWTTRFDSSPTYTPGAPDGAAPYWQFVNPTTAPMAAHPDQVFIDGTALKQVRYKSQVVAGTFFLDTATSQLYIGSNPSGRTVEASTNQKALTLQGANTVVRGIGVRRFAPSVPGMGAITVEQPGIKFENVVVQDSSTTGISVQATDASLTKVTVQRSGMLGITGRFADRLVLSGVDISYNNVERFNIAPVAGGVKLGATRGVTVTGSSFSNNYGHGFWEDMSVYNSVFRQSTFSNNVGTGLFLEISAKAIVGDNLIAGNGEFGIKVNNTSDVKVWNNTFAGNGRPLNIVQDSRRNTNRNDGAIDPRIAWPDPAMPWTLGPVTIANNVVAASTPAANCLLCVEDYSQQKTAEQMQIVANGNVYQRPSAGQPTWIVVWSRGPGNPYVFTTLAAFRQTTGQEGSGAEYVGSAILDSSYKLVSSVAGTAGSVAQPLPSDVASAIGRPAGSKTLGRW